MGVCASRYKRADMINPATITTATSVHIRLCSGKISMIDKRKPTMHPAPAACTLILKKMVMMVNVATNKLAAINIVRIRSLISIFE